MTETLKNERRLQRLEELCATTIRALTGQKDLRFRGRRLHKGSLPLAVNAPHLRTDVRLDGLADYRGIADGIALRLCFSDPDLHRRLSPIDPLQRFLFETLEQLRVESLAPERLPGVRRNVRNRFDQWCHAYHTSRLTETQRGILIYTLLQMVRSRLNGLPVLEATEDLIEATRFNLVPLIGNALAGLRKRREDQEAYAVYAIDVARILAGMIESNAAGDSDNDDVTENEAMQAAFALMLDFESDIDKDVYSVAPSGRSKVFEELNETYRIFSDRYDRQVSAASLVRPNLLRELRLRLDKRVLEHGINVSRLARQLIAVLARPRRDGWNFGEEEGYIDARRLGQLVASPAERRLFFQAQRKPRADCALTFLVDCSGSMKAHVESVAVLLDVFGRALELAGVDSEILGFTTGAWNGGRCQRDWMARGRPGNPGRLNEVTHIIFKSADTPWRRARPDIAAMLKADLFREGIDGEAVEWACRRMRGRDAQRRILIVISDGCPMDTATHLANDPFYLDNHLQQIIASQEKAGVVEIAGLGVGLDLSPFYEKSLTIDLSAGLRQQVFDEIVQLSIRRR